MNSNLKKILVEVIAFVEPLVPQSICSGTLAYANYTKGRYDLASRRVVNNKGLLSLKINYKLANNDICNLRSFFLNHKYEIERYFYKLPYEFIYDYARFSEIESINISTILAKVNKYPNRMRSIFFVLSMSYIKGVLLNINYDCDINKVLRSIFLIEKNIKRSTGKRELLLKHTLFRELLDLFGFDDEDIKCYVLKYSGNDKVRIYTEFIKLYPEEYALELLSENLLYLRSNLGRKKLLNIIKSTNNTGLYVKYYPKLIDFRFSSLITWLFYKRNYALVSKLVSVLSILGFDKVFDKCLYLTYLSLIEYSPKSAIKYLNKRDRKKLNVSSYLVLNSLYLGDLRKAELERTRIESSLQNYLNKVNGKVDVSDIETANHCLVVAEQGVADEVRWARLYSQLSIVENKKFTISCDPRFYRLFSNTYPDLTFIPHKRLFRRNPGMDIDMFHSLNIPTLPRKPDLIISTSLLFNYCDNVETTRHGYIDTCEHYKNSGLKIGILWSSSLAVGLRKERYGIPNYIYIKFVKKIQELGGSVYCLQSPLNEDDIIFCNSNNVIIDNTVDLYNDFDNSASFLSSLDYVVGPSSLVTELAAACGTKFLHIANAPEISLMRNGDIDKLSQVDQLSNNTITVYPKTGYIDDKEQVNNSCLEHAYKIIEKEIKK
ncbi:hypothetical protein CWO06_16470 [Vibrio splendidus]|nr:hypothetical protein CWN96_22240 [Vibrio splendidus]PTP53370.1 hypothetical protein CWO05_12130 [Vibrio splendidus]PTP73738.1 hypothetical protein CWO06_16470 [Vibrio splendidus]PTP92682.1 hypothetical protein CWO02_12285 [Vibrio splendidus]